MEGLALAGTDLTEDADAQGTINANGLTGVDRANEYGSLNGSLQEAVWRITVAGGMAASDVAQALFLNEGDEERNFRASLMDSDYTLFGGNFHCDDSSNECVYDFYLAKEYENNPDVEECGVTQYFGGSICDPSADEIDAFNAINAARTDGTSAFWKSDMDTLEG